MVEVRTYNIHTKKEEWIIIHGFIKIKKEKELKNNSNNLKKKYYKDVWRETLKNDLNKIMNGNKRGFHDYHIDHIIPISYGFKNNIPAEKIGAAENIRPLYWKKNLLKSARLNSGI